MSLNNKSLVNITKIAIVAALYVVLTVIVSPLSYAGIQLRFSEGLDHLVVFNKRYVWALTIGCFIANLFSPMGIIDIIFGTLETFLAAGITYLLSKISSSIFIKLLISILINTLMMWIIALELHLYNNLPFWPTYGTVALGEFISLTIGAVIIYTLNKYIDLKK